jgi:hypothetical protein
VLIHGSNFNKINCYYSAVQQKHKVLIINPFCHNFCSRKTKMPPKLSSSPTFDPRAKALPVPHGGRAIDNQYFKPAE